MAIPETETEHLGPIDLIDDKRNLEQGEEFRIFTILRTLKGPVQRIPGREFAILNGERLNKDKDGRYIHEVTGEAFREDP